VVLRGRLRHDGRLGGRRQRRLAVDELDGDARSFRLFDEDARDAQLPAVEADEQVLEGGARDVFVAVAHAPSYHTE
jgi:hypothetical protein